MLCVGGPQLDTLLVDSMRLCGELARSGPSSYSFSYFRGLPVGVWSPHPSLLTSPGYCLLGVPTLSCLCLALWGLAPPRVGPYSTPRAAVMVGVCSVPRGCVGKLVPRAAVCRGGSSQQWADPLRPSGRLRGGGGLAGGVWLEDAGHQACPLEENFLSWHCEPG